MRDVEGHAARLPIDEGAMEMTIEASVRRDKLLDAAEGYLMLQMPEHALKSLASVGDAASEEFRLHWLRGEAYRALERHEDALESLHEASLNQPDNVDVLMALAWCYKRVGQLNKSISAMEHAYRLRPREAVILYNLSCYWCLAGNKSQALAWLGRAVRMDGSLRDLIPDEHDFDALRDDPDFRLVSGKSDQASTAS